MPDRDGESLNRWGDAELEQLLRGVQLGDEDALERYVHAVTPLGRRHIERNTDPRLLRETSVEDLVQVALNTSIAGLKTFEYRSASGFHSWLHQCFENTIRHEVERHQARRRDYRRKVSLKDRDKDAQVDPVSPLQTVARRELAQRVRDAVATLDTLDRQLVEQVWLKGQTVTAVAQRLGLKQQTSYKRLHRAVTRLKFILGSEEP